MLSGVEHWWNPRWRPTIYYWNIYDLPFHMITKKRLLNVSNTTVPNIFKKQMTFALCNIIA